MSTSVVDQIRESLERQDGVSGEVMQPLAQAYADEVAKANDRLAICVNLLRKGLRSEAIQQANMRPNLIEWCARLDFPEIEEWFEILQFFQVDVPRTLNRDAVRQLQEALVEEQPLEELLRQHRRLAIGKAPLAWRLRILRRIASFDTTNTVWMDDIETWEKARLREIPPYLDAAVKAADVQSCLNLAAELESKEWRVHPSADLIKAVRDAADRLNHTSQSAQLKTIAGRLYDAFCAGDEAQCRREREQWHTIVAEMKSEPPKDVNDLAEPALIWLSEKDNAVLEEESRQQAIADLEQAIARSESVLALQKAYSHATRFGEALDPKLEAQYRAILGELQLRGSRRLLLRVASMVAVAIIALVSLGLWQWQSVRDGEVKNAVQALNQMLADEKLNEAQQYLQGLEQSKPFVVEHATVKAIASDLSGRVAAEEERVASFNKYLRDADNSNPERIDLVSLVEAEKIARTELEKGETFRVRQRKDAYDRQIENQQFQDLKREIERLTRELDRLESQDLNAIVDSDIDRIVTSIDALAAKYPRCGSSGMALANTLGNRGKTLRTAIRDAKQLYDNEQKAFASIRAATTLQMLEQALTSFSGLAPRSPFASEMAEVASEASTWQQAMIWNELLDSIGEYLRQHESSRLAVVREKLDTLKRSVECDLLSKQLVDFEQALAMAEARPGILERLAEELDRDIRSSLYTVQGAEKNGTPPVRFFAYSSYMSEDVVQKRLKASGSRGIEVLSARDGTVSTATFQGDITVSEAPKEVYEQIMASFTIDREAFLSRWEPAFLDLISKVYKHADLDYRIKERLILQLQKSASEGSWYFSNRLRESTNFLASRSAKNETNWYTPTPLQTNLVSEVTSRIGPVLSQSLRDIKLVDTPYQSLLKSRLVWIGTIQAGENGKRQAQITREPQGAGKLFVARQQASRPDSVALVYVGSLRAGNAVLDGDQSQCVIGRPIFYLPSATE